MQRIKRVRWIATFLLSAGPAWAQASSADFEPPVSAPSTYTAPFQLRGVVPRSGLRLDSTVGTYSREGLRGAVGVALFSAQARVDESVVLQLRWGAAKHMAASDGESRAGILNPTAGVLFGTRVSKTLRFGLSVSVGMPLGAGGGNHGDPHLVLMQRHAALARSSMDNTSFAVNDVGFPLGMSLAYVARGLTCQLDVGVIPSVRVKGELVQSDARKVNATSGLFVGQLVLPNLAFGFELRYQRFLSTPSAVAADPESRDNLTAALGARLSAELGANIWLRPAISYGRSVRGAGSQHAVQAVQLDLPLSF